MPPDTNGSKMLPAVTICGASAVFSYPGSGIVSRAGALSIVANNDATTLAVVPTTTQTR